MSPNQSSPSRRTVLAAGGVAIGLGIVGASAVEFASDDGPPGVEGFTAKTVPAGSDPLVLVDADRVAPSGTAATVTRTLLGAGQFGNLPDALVGMFGDGSRSTIDPRTVGKLVFVGSDADPDHGGAVVWADWTADELVEVLESGGDADTEVRTDSYGDRTLYTTGETSAVVLGDTEFALGTPRVVRAIVDVWHADGTPVGGTTLHSFERTPLEATVRFSFGNVRLPCDDAMASESEAYDAITQVYGSAPVGDDGVRVHLRVDSNDATREVATALRSDLGLADDDGPEGGVSGLPSEAVDAVAVGHDDDVVTVEYDPEVDESEGFARAVVETTVCVIGRSG